MTVAQFPIFEFFSGLIDNIQHEPECDSCSISYICVFMQIISEIFFVATVFATVLHA